MCHTLRKVFIASIWTETERGTTETSFCNDIREDFLKTVLKSPVNQANSMWQLVFFSLPQVPSENAHLSPLFTFPRPGLDCAMTPEVLKEVVCILEILFPAVSLENTSQGSRVVSMK